MDAEEFRWCGPAQSFDGGEVLAIRSGPPWHQFTIVYSVPNKPERAYSKAANLAAFDARLAELERERKEREAAAGTPAPIPPRKRRKRRTKAEMAAARAERANKKKAAVAGTYLEGYEDEVDQWLQAIRTT